MTDPQVIVNLGTGGSDLNGQNGSTSSADSNDARFLDWPGDNAGNYVYLPGVTNNSLSVPDEAALDITDEIDIRLHVALESYRPASTIQIMTKWWAGAAARSWLVDVQASGALRFQYTNTGSSGGAVYTSSAGLPDVDNASIWIRVTWTNDNGTGNSEANFYTSSDGSTWVALGVAQTNVTTDTIYSGSSPIRIGSFNTSGGESPFKFYRAQVLDGIDGTTVLDVDTSVITSGSATSFTALTGQTVTINRSSSGRKSVAVVSPVWLFGTDDYMEVADNALLDFGASDSFTVLVITRIWSIPNSFTRYISKEDATSVGYRLLNNSTNNWAYTLIDDGPNNVSTSTSVNTYVYGDVTVIGSVRDTAADTLRHYVKSGFSTPVTDTTTGSLANDSPLRIGTGTPSVVAYAEMELLGIAIFRRALTGAEIASINTYYQNKVA